MMRPITKVYTTSGNQGPIILDRYVNGYAIGVQMKTAGIIYTLQYTTDDPTYDAIASNTFPNAGNLPVKYSVGVGTSGTWFNWDDPLLVAASTNRSTNLAFAPTAVRVSISSKCSAGNPLWINIIPTGMDGN